MIHNNNEKSESVFQSRTFEEFFLTQNDKPRRNNK